MYSKCIYLIHQLKVLFSDVSEHLLALVSRRCCTKHFSSPNFVSLLHPDKTIIEKVSSVSYVTGYCAGIYSDMRNAKLSCCKIFAVVYFGSEWHTDTGAFASANAIGSLYKLEQNHVVIRLEVKSTEYLTVSVLIV